MPCRGSQFSTFITGNVNLPVLFPPYMDLQVKFAEKTPLGARALKVRAEKELHFTMALVYVPNSSRV